jgi:hypothetical protein
MLGPQSCRPDAQQEREAGTLIDFYRWSDARGRSNTALCLELKVTGEALFDKMKGVVK